MSFLRSPRAFAAGFALAAAVAAALALRWSVRSERVHAYRTAEGTWVVSREAFTHRTRWTGTGWEWIPRSENGSVGDTLIAVWRPDGGYWEDRTGLHVEGELLVPLGEWPDPAPGAAEPPMRFQGNVRGELCPVGTWQGFVGTDRKVVEGELGAFGGLDRVRGWHLNGAPRFEGGMNGSLEASGVWTIWSEDGSVLAHGEVAHGRFEEPQLHAGPLEFEGVGELVDAIERVDGFGSEEDVTWRIGARAGH